MPFLQAVDPMRTSLITLAEVVGLPHAMLDGLFTDQNESHEASDGEPGEQGRGLDGGPVGGVGRS